MSKTNKQYKKYLILLVFLSFLFCTKNAPDDNDILAKVGDDVITVKDFRIAYELFPVFKKRSNITIPQRKILQLNALIENKILAKAAERRDVHKQERVKILLQWHKDRAVIRQLYKTVVKNKVNVSEEEIRIGYKRLNTRLMLRKLYFISKDQAWDAYNAIQKGKKFEDIASVITNSKEELKHILTAQEFLWADLDERLEKAAYKLKKNEISKPVELKNGFYLIQLLNKKEQLILSENDFQNRSHYIENIIRRRREARLSKAYALSLMEKLNPQANMETLQNLIKSAKAAFLEFDKKNIPNYLQTSIIRPHITGLLDEVAIEFNGGKWTVKELLDRIDKIHPSHRVDLFDLNSLPVNLSVMIRDDALVKQGYKQNLDKELQAQKNLLRKREKVLSLYMRKALIDTIRITKEEVLSYYQKNEALYIQPEMVKIKEVMVRDKNLADSLYSVVKNGADISVIAKNYSVRKWAAEKGGEIGYFAKGAFSNLGDCAFKLKPGDLSDIIDLKVDGITVGYSFFNVIDKMPSKTPEYLSIIDIVFNDALKAKKDNVEKRFFSTQKDSIPIFMKSGLLGKIKTTDELHPGKAMEFMSIKQF